MPKTLKDKVTEILVDQLGVDEEECTPEASITDDLGADSLDKVELIMAFEAEFDLEISDETAEPLKTVQDILDYLKSKGVAA